MNIKKILIAVVGILVLGVSGCGSHQNPVLIAAHRGASSSAPENTLAAFEKAVEMGADFIELDVAETKDGVLIILHDDSLERTAQLTANIWDVTYEETQELDAGSWFDESYSGEKIPTLQEAIDICKGKIKMNIEIKSTGHESADFVEQIVQTIRSNQLQEACIVTSFDYPMVQEIKELDPSIRTGVVLSKEEQRLSDFDDMDLFSIYWKILDKTMVEEAHSMGKQVHVWTVNKQKDMRRFQKMGVDCIITNDPGLADKVCN